MERETNRQMDRQMKGHSLKLVECKAEQKHDKEMVSVPEHFKVRSPVRQRGKRTQTGLSKIACEAKGEENLNSFQRLPTFSAYRINSREEVTIRNRATLMTCPVTPAAVTKQVVMGS